ALSYPFIGVYNAGAALFRAQGNSKISMLSSLVMNVENIGGNAILIYRFGMGVMGAATASLVSRMIACFTVMFLLQKPDCALRIDHLTDLKPDLDLLKRILKVGIPAGIENGMFQIGKLSVSSLTSTLGTAAIAA
ncbi:polysaccharide biosynthesis C-terminal domain-containing protein, partial [Faecalibacterium sp. DFI.5.82]|uniref:polysaccharide biosynthesis C-terminal domain-containing protein n=1 Tax=Faecalibacterium sp. DFI.5.82 TaxID=3031725 RepID=UPI0023AF4AC8